MSNSQQDKTAAEDSAKWYRGEFEKPLKDIKEDIFFRADNFQNEEWYGQFSIFQAIGVCQPEPEHVSDLQKALKIMGYNTRVSEHEGKTYIVPDESRNRKKDEYER